VPTPPRQAVTAAPPAPNALAGLDVRPRSAWTRRPPSAGNINPMQGATKLTVHHEGWTPVSFTDPTATSRRIEQIRRAHVEDRGWADIGYHFVVDRAGIVWQGRELRYQGAHVRDHNEHNIGVLVLGNFDRQSPTDAQTRSLVMTMRGLLTRHRISPARVYTHQEINPTACPGRALQQRMVAIRSRRMLG
jgi:hypothetical protein